MVQKDFVISNKERSLSWDKPALVAWVVITMDENNSLMI